VRGSWNHCDPRHCFRCRSCGRAHCRRAPLRGSLSRCRTVAWWCRETSVHRFWRQSHRSANPLRCHGSDRHRGQHRVRRAAPRRSRRTVREHRRRGRPAAGAGVGVAARSRDVGDDEIGRWPGHPGRRQHRPDGRRLAAADRQGRTACRRRWARCPWPCSIPRNGALQHLPNVSGLEGPDRFRNDQCLRDGRVFLVDDLGSTDGPNAEVWTYDPGSGQSRLVGRIHQDRFDLFARPTRLADGRWLIVGGEACFSVGEDGLQPVAAYAFRPPWMIR
jgi:hypothetical protein